MKAANDWTRDKFTEWGLVNSHLESYPFGRGWSNEYTEVRMVVPQASPMLAYPKAWTVGTNGVLRAPVVKAKLATQADLDKYKGQLAGKIVLNGDMREIKPGDKPALRALRRQGTGGHRAVRNTGREAALQPARKSSSASRSRRR